MSATLRLDDPSVVSTSHEIGETSFGTKYTAFRSFDRFDAQTEDVDYGMIHWPGGNFAEREDGRFGFQHKGLFAPSNNHPDLEEVFEFAFENDIAVTITLPTQMYQDDPDGLVDGARSFLEDLHSGEFGPLPDTLIIEIGNEFYDVFEGATEVDKAVDYAAVVNTYTDVISEVESRFDVDPEQVSYTVQTGLGLDANQAILDNLSDESLLNTDYLSHHRYPFEARGSDLRIETTQQVLENYDAAVEDLGGEGPSLFVSEYNTASITRNEAAGRFLAQQDDDTLTRADLDMDGRSNLAFEQFYQDQLDIRDYGMEQAETILQTFSEYQGIGAEAMTSYGWDMVHAGRHSFEGTDGEDYLFVGGAIQDMMAESLHGTRVVDWYQDNDHGRWNEDEVSAFGFDSADKLVMFLTAPETDDAEMTFDIPLDDLGPLQSVWGESLTAAPPDNWHELFDIPDVPGLDQSAEAETFSVAQRAPFQPEIDDGFLTVTFDEPGEVIRLVFARNDAGQNEIEQWHGTDHVDIDGVVPEVDQIEDIAHVLPPVVPPAPVSDPVSEPVVEPDFIQAPEPPAVPTSDPIPPSIEDMPTIPAEPDFEDPELEDNTEEGSAFDSFPIDGILGAILIPLLAAFGLN